jgi:selenium-binding protein 1
MVLELRPAHNPVEAYGFAGVVTSLKDLSASVWLWYRDASNNGEFQIRKIIEVPAEPVDSESLPPMLKGFKAVPPLVTDLNLSLDDRSFRAGEAASFGSTMYRILSAPNSQVP